MSVINFNCLTFASFHNCQFVCAAGRRRILGANVSENYVYLSFPFWVILLWLN